MRHVKEHLAGPILNLIWQATPRVVKLDRFDIDLGVEGVLIEENRAARKVGHVKSFLKNIVINTVRCFLPGNNMPFRRNGFLKCVFSPTSGPKVPVVDAEASSAQEIN